MFKKSVMRLLVAACAAIAALAIAAPASAANVGSSIGRNGTLWVNDYIQRTSNGYYYWLILQSDGSLVLYKGNSAHVASKVCWASGTWGKPSGHAIYQTDGNFVIYSTSNVPLWGSNTVGETGATVDISASGRLYVGYTPISSAC
jgi:hypothetical protein